MKIIENSWDWVNWSEKEIKEITQTVKEKMDNYVELVSKIEVKDLSFENLIHTREVMYAEVLRYENTLFPFVHLHTDEKIRDLARKVELEVSKIGNEFSYNETVYKKFTDYFNGNFKKEKKSLTGEQIKIVEDTNKGYKKMGMHLDKKTKKQILDIKNKITRLGQKFEVNNTKNYERGLWFKKEELIGVPEKYFSSFKFDEKKKKYFINCSGRDDLGTDYPIVKKYCTNAKTREVITTFNEKGVGIKNLKFLGAMLKQKEILRKILGYKTWADLAVSEEMMNKPTEINSFLKSLQVKLLKPFESDKKLLEKILQEKGEKLNTSSYAFAEQILKEKTLPIAEKEFEPYLEIGNVLRVLFNTWEKYFQVKTEILPSKKVLHEDTIVTRFTDTKTGEILGDGILDLHPRHGKYGHACVADIFKKYLDLGGNKHAGTTFLVCNFRKNTEGKTYVSVSDMNTLYHEAGHMLHMILMKNNYPSTGQTSRDFVEIPSQFHENFLYTPEFVRENFIHCETGEKMSKEMSELFLKISNRGQAKEWKRVTTQAMFDQEVHGGEIKKYAQNAKLINSKFEFLWKKYNPLTPTKTRNFPSVFAHIVGGYDARYYSYVISRVYAQDFWHEFVKKGLGNEEMVQKYKSFLEAANTQEEKELTKKYLGRKVSLNPFINFLKASK